MKVENQAELASLSKKLEYKNSQEAIAKETRSLFDQKAFALDKQNSKNQLFKLGENTAEDIQDAAANQQSGFVKDAMAALSSSTTAQDLTKLEEEGYSFCDAEIDTIVTVTDKIQIYLATHCEDYEAVGDIDLKEVEKVAGSTQLAYDVAKKLKDNNLPITEENMEESIEAVRLASQLEALSKGAVKYMLTNQLQPTIENIYKAEFSGKGTEGGSYGAGYFTEGTGYYGKTSDQYDWKALEGQMEKVIQDAGLEVNEETMADAKWLVENHIPLTAGSLSGMEKLKEIAFPVDKEQLINQIAEALIAGRRPGQAYLTDEPGVVQRAEEALEIIQNVTDEELEAVIRNLEPVTIENLKKAQEGRYSQEGASERIITEDDIQLITARRQLEEIRLKMTVEANLKLLRQGITIETKELEALIDELKGIEDGYYRQLMESGNVETSGKNMDLFKEVSTKVQDIKYVPNAVLGQVVKGDADYTINGIHTSGTALKASYDNANEQYESLMTKPRADMGDSINKAFRNVDDILQDLDLELTENNRRAVRILGYNSMDITKENIAAVKESDAAVNAAIRNMTPQVVLELIRRGVNPLDKNIDDLNLQLKEIQAAIGDKGEEKYSEFLYKLERNEEITQEEREAYVGLYRLINQVVKTDGGVIGALVNQNADLTLNNLLTGVRTIKNKGVNVKVDDSFKGMETAAKNASISEQIEMGFDGETNTEQQAGSKETYYQNLLEQTLSEISPEKLQKLFKEGKLQDMTLEKFVDQVVNSEEDGELTEAFFKEQLARLKEASKVEDSVIRLLEDFDQPVTINNLLAANSLLTQRGSMFRKLIEKARDKDEFTELMNKLPDSLESEEKMQETYDELKGSAEEILDEAAEQPSVSSVDIREIKLLRNEIRLTANLSREEKYEIPVKIGDELTSVNLTIIHGEETGKVYVTMDNKLYGKASAEFVLEGKDARGYIVAGSKEELMAIQKGESRFTRLMKKAGLNLENVEYIMGPELDINGRRKDIQQPKEERDKASTKDLYNTARAFVEVLQKIS